MIWRIYSSLPSLIAMLGLQLILYGKNSPKILDTMQGSSNIDKSWNMQDVHFSCHP
jgi:hypothetical protein